MPLAFTEFVKVFLLILIGAQTVIAFTTDYLKRGLFTDGKLYPIWFPLSQARIDDMISMPEIFGDKVIMMKSLNQYTEVTTEHRKEDIRMSLKDAVSLVDEDRGLRVHRSYWVRKSEIEALSYKNGNPFMTLRNGETVPVGRQVVETVKAILG